MNLKLEDHFVACFAAWLVALLKGHFIACFEAANSAITYVLTGATKPIQTTLTLLLIMN